MKCALHRAFYTDYAVSESLQRVSNYNEFSQKRRSATSRGFSSPARAPAAASSTASAARHCMAARGSHVSTGTQPPLRPSLSSTPSSTVTHQCSGVTPVLRGPSARPVLPARRGPTGHLQSRPVYPAPPAARRNSQLSRNNTRSRLSMQLITAR